MASERGEWCAGGTSFPQAVSGFRMMAMKEASETAFGAGYDALPVWKERLAARTIVTTPSLNVVYA